CEVPSTKGRLKHEEIIHLCQRSFTPTLTKRQCWLPHRFYQLCAPLLLKPVWNWKHEISPWLAVSWPPLTTCCQKISRSMTRWRNLVNLSKKPKQLSSSCPIFPRPFHSLSLRSKNCKTLASICQITHMK